MSIEMVRIGDICTVVSGSTPKTSVAEYWDGNIKWITPAELDENSFYLHDSVRHITDLGKEKTGLSCMPVGTVILSSRAPIGKTAIAGCEMCCNQGFKNLICSERIFNEYLYYFLSAKTDYLNSLGRGATFKEISKSIVENIVIPLPPISEQKEISNRFTQINTLIKLRKEQLEQLNQLVMSRFIELFGDPITNSKKLPQERMEQRFSLKAGITTAADDIHEFEPNKYETPCYGGNGIRGYVKEKSYSGNYPIIGRQGALCGNVQYATGDFHATEHAVLVSLLKDDNTVWVYHLLKLMDLYRYHTGAAQPGLAVKTLNTVNVIVADKATQNEFAAFAEHTDKLKFAVGKAAILYSTLLLNFTNIHWKRRASASNKGVNL